VRRSFQSSALNLAHYLALRRRDLRELQPRLTALGLSSLGRCEARVKANLDALVATLSYIAPPRTGPLPHPLASDVFAGDDRLHHNAAAVLGRLPPGRRVRIMVTLPSEAANDSSWMENLLRSGADAVRINCAHDSPDEWARMVENVRLAEKRTARRCRILMDLAGPKLRIGEVRTPRNEDRLHEGDSLLLAHRLNPRLRLNPFQTTCTCPEIIRQLKVGERVHIDDGRIQSCVEAIHPAGVLLRITRTRPKGEKLRPEKSLNFPDSTLDLEALTTKDRADIGFIAHFADVIGYSFVQKAEDIDALEDALAPHCRRKKLALVAKIETARAISNLPALIVRASGSRPFAVMIARGDLAVEIGFERLAEMQEEILWLCEAAHTPVIWATQVLENFAKNGLPSRAEVTDAAMAERAECVMLNKGPFIIEVVGLLARILTRMGGHMVKKTPQLRALQSWPMDPAIQRSIGVRSPMKSPRRTLGR
jgi:pyruvate kinase